MCSRFVSFLMQTKKTKNSNFKIINFGNLSTKAE